MKNTSMMTQKIKHFIFGYGSLICPKSRSITAPSLHEAIAEPVLVVGIERIWAAKVIFSRGQKNRDHIQGCTPMGIRKRQGAICNGVLIHVDDEELARFDIREEGYKRHKIDLVDVYPHCESADCRDDPELLKEVACPECRIVFERAHRKRTTSDDAKSDDMGLPKISVWVYIQNDDSSPNPSFPITQSYVDIIMRGCLSISKEFTSRFLQTTHGWWQDGLDSVSDDSRSQHHTWVDDRQSPMYVRADSDYSIEHGDMIDQLLEEHHPHALKKRVVSM